MQRPRGFTMMEAAVTLAIGMIVLFAAVTLQVLITKTYTSARRVAELSDRVVSLSS
jgi:Tfp pilus assembly protein PilW